MKEVPYDIPQLIHTLKIQNWKKIVPFEFYLTPLQKSLKDVRDELSKLEKDGVLLVKYIVENNEDL